VAELLSLPIFLKSLALGSCSRNVIIITEKPAHGQVTRQTKKGNFMPDLRDPGLNRRAFVLGGVSGAAFAPER
jgi:hypothetical protein